jgi:tetratricopeptide (TPR) repeat protein
VDEALADAEQACRLEPHNPGARATLGVALVHASRPRDAVAALEAVVAIWPRSALHWRWLAQARSRDGQLDAAAAAIARALELKPNDAANLGGLGKIQYTRGQHAAATATFERVLEVAPADYEALVNLAGLRWAAGERDAAIELLARARGVAPQLEPAWAPSFAYLAAVGRPRDAVELRVQYLAARPQERGGRIVLIQSVLQLPAAAGDAQLLARTFAELASAPTSPRCAARRPREGTEVSSGVRAPAPDRPGLRASATTCRGVVTNEDLRCRAARFRAGSRRFRSAGVGRSRNGTPPPGPCSAAVRSNR